ncbi:dihydrolipoyl dehydrogenase family protein [Halorarius halobius]|uniref:dihydrolipoyl dehydrogenase family protein n=1 Tax=Halorarius halobius TaxID=2962671 RepID=UPI0020CCCF7F|nr:dihydrolipoyl dehydrogenase [Halorarius halobius]
MEEYDLVVVGSGSGLDVANAAANSGWDVAVVEKGPLGGTCLNRGCIPSKHLLHHADVARTIHRADEYHIDARIESVDFETIVESVNAEVDTDSDGIEQGWREADDRTLVQGEARFVDERTLAVDDRELRGEHVVVAVGTRPAIPPIDGIEDVPYLTSTEALRLTERPDSLVVVGGGYIAAELGHFFGTFGTDVTVVGRRPHLLPETDPEVGDAFTEAFARRHTVYTGYEATAVEATDDGLRLTAREWPDGDGEVTVEADELLVAAGRRPNTDLLDAAAGGVDTDDAGFVDTDDYLRTSAENVWALGDVVGEYLLKHSANHEASTVARNLLGDELDPVDYTAMPYGVFAAPEVAGVGATSDDLREAGRRYAVRTYPYTGTARGQAYHADEGLATVLVDPDDATILGCHVVGPEATSLIQEVVVSMKAGSGTVRDVRESVHIHPAMTEVIGRAFSGQFRLPEHLHDHGHEEHDHGHGD